MLQLSNKFALIGLFFLGVALNTVVWLITDVLYGSPWNMIVTALTVLIFGSLWVVIPLMREAGDSG